MTRDQFMSQAVASGKSKDEIKKVYDSIDASGEFDSDTSETPILKPEQNEAEKYGVAGALFPRSMRGEENNAGVGSRLLSAGADVLSLPQRTLSGAATGAGTLAGGGSLKNAIREGVEDTGNYKSKEKGTLGFAQNMAYDPTLFVPGLGLAGKGIKTAIKSGKPLARLGKSALIGLGQGGTSAALQSSNGDKNIDYKTIGATAALGGALPLAGAGLVKAARTGVSKLLSGAAERNVNIELRPGQTGANKGFDADNALKHDLIGSVRDVADKSKTTLAGLQAQAKQLAKDSDEKFSVGQMFDDVIANIDPKKHASDYEKMVKYANEEKAKFVAAFGDIVDAPDAMAIRTQIGEKTAFVGRRDAKGMSVDPEADWKEKVSNNLYGKFKDELHSKVGSELKAINKAQSEIIPVRQVALRRLPISESNNRLGLMDGIMFTAGATAALAPGDGGDRARNGILTGAALALARRGAGSAFATKAMYNASKAIAPKVVPQAEKVVEKSTLADLPKDWNIPSYQRKGTAIENSDIGLHPYDGKKAPKEGRLALPAPMLNNKQKIEPLIPTKGERMKSLGESGAPEFDNPIIKRLSLPSPEEIKKLYPHLSEEDIKKVIYQLDDRKALSAPMLDNENPLQRFERQYPTLGQRLGAIGELKGKKLKTVPFTLLKTRKDKK